MIFGQICFKHLTKKASIRGARIKCDVFFLGSLSYIFLLKPPYPIYVEVGTVLVDGWSEMKVAPPFGATCVRNFLEQVPLHPCSLFVMNIV
jgi:hypothetical protein